MYVYIYIYMYVYIYMYRYEIYLYIWIRKMGIRGCRANHAQRKQHTQTTLFK